MRFTSFSLSIRAGLVTYVFLATSTVWAAPTPIKNALPMEQSISLRRRVIAGGVEADAAAETIEKLGGLYHVVEHTNGIEDGSLSSIDKKLFDHAKLEMSKPKLESTLTDSDMHAIANPSGEFLPLLSKTSRKAAASTIAEGDAKGTVAEGLVLEHIKAGNAKEIIKYLPKDVSDSRLESVGLGRFKGKIMPAQDVKVKEGKLNDEGMQEYLLTKNNAYLKEFGLENKDGVVSKKASSPGFIQRLLRLKSTSKGESARLLDDSA
ncbi:hypothetical protein FRB97_000264 [Tulasnella sp. 331]|nr:hypothetical protein FRB97_000264 [Tulasnella sp. 331]